MWFESLTGFVEESPEQVRSNIQLEGQTMRSTVNGRIMTWGTLDVLSLQELRSRAQEVSVSKNASVNAETSKSGDLSVREVVADAQSLHLDPVNEGALFQVASQMNLLEMVGPEVTPEKGVGIYEQDLTQGPACAIAAGAGTIYRNYFVPVDGQVGQSADRQINCLQQVGQKLGNEPGELWRIQNGYVLPSQAGLETVDEKLKAMSSAQLDEIRDAIQIGLQRETEVTLEEAGHLVSQVYCSALPVAYTTHSRGLWEAFARLVLEGAYEATLYAGAINAARTGNQTVYLTLLGGGAFGNKKDWIIDAIDRACSNYSDVPLDVAIVSYRQSDSDIRQLMEGH